jgi:hypothetical protein
MSQVQLEAFFLVQNACTAFPSTLVCMLELSPPLPILPLLRVAGRSGLNTIIVHLGRAIAQTVSRRLPTATARVRSQVRSCGGQSGTGAGSFCEYFRSPCQFSFHRLLIMIITRGLYSVDSQFDSQQGYWLILCFFRVFTRVLQIVV